MGVIDGFKDLRYAATSCFGTKFLHNDGGNGKQQRRSDGDQIGMHMNKVKIKALCVGNQARKQHRGISNKGGRGPNSYLKVRFLRNLTKFSPDAAGSFVPLLTAGTSI